MKLTQLTSRKIGKKFESFVTLELEKSIPNSIVIPLQDTSISTQFTDILAITDKKIVGIECKVTSSQSFTVKNIRQLVKLRKLVMLNKNASGYFVIHLAYETELTLENIRVVNVGKTDISILKWEDFIDEIKNK